MAAAEMVGKNRTVFATDIHPVAIEHIQKSASKRGCKNIKTILMADNTGADKVDKGDISRENIFQIMDGIITQLNKTKKMFIIMILTIDPSANSICTYIRIIWSAFPL